jgi:ArsR family transcriptional regulator, lead/cadmium/zinc/bismuth-responsive transcriptional repressor
MKNNSYEQFFANFSNYTRMKIVLALADGPLSVGDLSERVGEEQSNVSHHFKQMAHCSLVEVRRDGKKRIYSLNEKTVKPMLEMAREHVYGCCGNCSECDSCGFAESKK